MGFFSKTSRFLNKTIVGKAISGAVGSTPIGRAALNVVNEAGRERNVVVTATQPEVTSVARSAQSRAINNNNNNKGMETNKIIDWIKANKVIVAVAAISLGVAAYFLFLKKKVGRK